MPPDEGNWPPRASEPRGSHHQRPPSNRVPPILVVQTDAPAPVIPAGPWWTVHEFVAPSSQRPVRGRWSAPPNGALLDDDDPRKIAAIFDSARHWALRIETCQEAYADAGSEISAAADWSRIAQYIRVEREFYAAHPWMKRVVVMTDDQEAKEKTDKAEKRSIASQLVDLARSDYELGVSDDGIPFGSRPDVPHVAMPLRGGKFGLRAELGRHYFEKCNAVPSSQALTDAINVLEGYAAQENPKTLTPAGRRGQQHGVHPLRRQQRPRDRDQRRQLEVHRVRPIVFRRTELTAPMPEPVRGGDCRKLWKHINVA